MRDVPKGLLRIGMVPFSGQVFMPRAITRFVREFGDVRVQVQTAMSGVLIGWLRNDTIDVAVMHSPWAGLDFACEPLVYGGMVLVLPPGPSAFGCDGAGPFTLSQVAPMPLILATTENPQRVLLEGAALAQGLTLNVVLEADNLATILALVHEGLGCTVSAYGAVHAMAGDRRGPHRFAGRPDPDRHLVRHQRQAAGHGGDPAVPRSGAGGSGGGRRTGRDAAAILPVGAQPVAGAGPYICRASRPRPTTLAWISAAPSKMFKMRASHSTRLTGYSWA